MAWRDGVAAAVMMVGHENVLKEREERKAWYRSLKIIYGSVNML